MGTALTDSQLLSVFQIMEIPWNNNAAANATPGYNTMDGMGTLAAQTLIGAATTVAAQTTLLTYLDNLHTNRPLIETELITLVTRWQTIGTTPVKMEGGQVGSLTGVTYDYQLERAYIIDRVKIIVPFYRYHEVEARRNGDMGPGAGGTSGKSANINTVR